VSFRGELKGFVSGFKAGSDILYRNAARKNIEMNLPLFGPEDLDKVPGSFQPGGGGDVGTARAPSVTGGSDDTRRRPRSRQEAYRQGIANIESGGGNYNAVGAKTKSGDRAYGKYQIMGANIPVWTKQVLGQSMTPEQFLKSPEAQDYVFDNVFGGYVKKYGLQGAARAWFGGPGAVDNPNATDIHGKLTTGSYGRQFAAYVTNLGDLPDVSGDEMAETRDKIGPNAWWDDTGYYPEGKPERQAAAEELPAEEEEEGAIAESPEITAPEVDLTPQAQQPVLVPEEEEERYAMGGVIPEDDTQYFQEGGQPDPYNPSRGFTQTDGYTPPPAARRIQLPGAGTAAGGAAAAPAWRTWGAGASPAQQGFRDTRAKQAADEAARQKAAADAAAAAAAKQQTPAGYTPQEMQRFRATQMLGIPLAPGAWKDVQAKATPQQYTDLRMMGYGGGGGGGGGLFGQGGKRRGGHLAEGGMVHENFAKGGKVAKRRDTRNDRIDWAEMNRRAGRPSFEETIKKYDRPGASQRGDGAQGVRDRAAREMNARAGRPPSTAWRDTPYVRPAAAPREAPVRPAPPVRPVAPRPSAPPPTVTGGAPVDDGRMPQVDPMGNPVGANYPPPSDMTNDEIQKQLDNDEVFQRKQREFRAKAAADAAPVIDPVTGQPLEVTAGSAMASGGVIPDEPVSYARGGRVEEAGYTTSATGRRSSARKKSDPWAGMRTKASKKVRKPSTDTVKRGAAKRKKKGASQPGKQRRQGLPERAPIPPERPGRLPDTAPIPPARPARSAGIPPAMPGANRQEGEAQVMNQMYRDRLGPGQREPEPPMARPSGDSRSFSDATDTRGFNERMRMGVLDKYSIPGMAEAQAVRGGGAAPPVQQTVRPVQPGDYGPPLTPASRGMQAFTGGPEPLPERFGREPVMGGELPPEYYEEEELVTSPGLAYQRGGVIPDDTDRPFQRGAKSRGGALHNVFGGSKNIRRR
jgi:hypothetical protein